MDTGTFKAIELIVIVGAVVWLYSSQQRNLKRLKDEREARQQAETSSDDKPPDPSQ
jgi:NADH:ubiquinone oxidoreductase subunit 6 (subunit J)